jgi:UDP-N-acetylmuramate dehydrogenase
MRQQKVFEWLPQYISNPSSVFYDEPMKSHTTFRIGGPAECLVLPSSIEELISIVRECRRRQEPFVVIGNGSNLLVSDHGIKGLVIQTTKMCGRIELTAEGLLTADAGCLLSRVAQVAAEGSMANLEFAQGIPGTFGGAVLMNAGAYGTEMKDIVETTQYLDENGEIRTLLKEEHDFSYRHSYFSNRDCIILQTKLQLIPGDKKEIKEKMDQLAAARKEKQPLNLPSAGSVFKRPPGHFAGKLIEDCGLKGYKVGGAQVSPKHAGFIVNTGDATANDVLVLIDKIRSEVFSQFKVELQCEIKCIGKK